MTKIPLNLQFELALLWRTLSIIKSNNHLSLISFYEQFLPIIKRMPNLSLSTYWDDISKTNSSFVGIPRDKCTDDRLVEGLVNIAELNYLRHEESIDSKHDPLQLVENLYAAAAVFIPNSNHLHRNTVISACLAIAVKSGRASLLLHFTALVSSITDSNQDADIDCIKDICDYLTSLEPSTSQVTKCISRKRKLCAFNDSCVFEPLLYTKRPYSEHVHCFASHNNRNSVQNDGIIREPGGFENRILLSFGKADHGIYIILIILFIVNNCFWSR